MNAYSRVKLDEIHNTSLLEYDSVFFREYQY